ncbi:MAG TPA: hypothetical protein PLM20_09700, partial [Syntrophomonadaceae bacterium]|nr:hypothetical protein [Syntrophomonadaceae bacterium]
YSFYHYLVQPTVKRKYVLKGGPGVGKSNLMKEIAQHFSKQGYNIEYHWCSSDPDSLDGIVIGSHQVAVLDGTAPHVVDPRYPGAVDEIINLGQYWQHSNLTDNREHIIEISDQISFCFQRAYHRLAESQLALQEWTVYLEKVRNDKVVARNTLALVADFLKGTEASADTGVRHLFAGAITPAGIILKAEHILEADTALYAIKGSPGSGVRDLIQHLVHMIELNGVRAEIFHNPFDPDQIDMVFLPDYQRALLNVSDYLFEYAEQLSGARYKRLLDFDQLLPQDSLNPYAKRIALAKERLENGIKEAIEWIALAKQLHDRLEEFYIKAMDFLSLDQQRDDLIEDIEFLLNQ